MRPNPVIRSKQTRPSVAGLGRLPTSPGTLAATIYALLGINPDVRIPSALGQPAPLVEDGQPLDRLFV
jgi:hypothetical protein